MRNKTIATVLAATIITPTLATTAFAQETEPYNPTFSTNRGNTETSETPAESTETTTDETTTPETTTGSYNPTFGGNGGNGGNTNTEPSTTETTTTPENTTTPETTTTPEETEDAELGPVLDPNGLDRFSDNIENFNKFKESKPEHAEVAEAYAKGQVYGPMKKIFNETVPPATTPVTETWTLDDLKNKPAEEIKAKVKEGLENIQSQGYDFDKAVKSTLAFPILYISIVDDWDGRGDTPFEGVPENEKEAFNTVFTSSGLRTSTGIALQSALRYAGVEISDATAFNMPQEVMEAVGGVFGTGEGSDDENGTGENGNTENGANENGATENSDNETDDTVEQEKVTEKVTNKKDGELAKTGASVGILAILALIASGAGVMMLTRRNS